MQGHTPSEVEGFLGARRVALIGASSGARDSWSFNARMTRSLLASSFDEVVLVTRDGDEIAGRATYRSLGEYRNGLAGDLCVLVVPRAQLVTSLESAVEAGWSRFLIITGQLSSDDRHLLSSLTPDTARVWGPNCVGFVVAEGNRRLMASDYTPNLRPGRARIAILSQSGGAVGALATMVEGLGSSVSHLLSVGEEVDVGSDDILHHLATSGDADGVILFVEEARRPERFLAALDACAASGVPVAIVKVGQTQRGRAVAQSHSGALVGDWHDFAAAAVARDVMMCSSLREGAGAMAAATVLRCRGPVGRRIAFFSSSGGSCALACDLAATNGLALAGLTTQTSDTLMELTDHRIEAPNPFDSADGGGTPKTLPTYLDAVGSDPTVDALVLIHGGALYGELIVDELTKERGQRRPTLAVWPGMPAVLRDRLLDDQVLVVDDLGDACRWLSLAADVPDDVELPLQVEDGVETASDDDDRWLSYADGLAVMDRFDIPTASSAVLHNASEIDELLQGGDTPFPVVVKGGNLRGHKARAGGVARNVVEAARLREVAATFIDKFDQAVVERQVPPGVEVLIATRDGAFGSTVTLGIGGVYADVLGNQMTMSLDASEEDFRSAIAGTLVGQVLASTGRPEAARAATADLVTIIGGLRRAMVSELLDTIELNPVIVGEEGVVACDIKARRKTGRTS